VPTTSTSADNPLMSRILVTGGSGFVGGHCIVQLLAQGHDVRTTVRSLKRESEVRESVRRGGVPDERLSFAEADLEKDSGWNEAVSGCEYVLHVASPFPPKAPKHEDELIVPAREGALRVLKASRDAGVKRVVLTSSFAAVGYGLKAQSVPFDETNWTNPESPEVSAYVKSKTLAERAAWDFMSREGGALTLSVVNPVGIVGPLLSPDFATSILLVQRMLDGSMPAVPPMKFGIVDVRDVTSLHLLAMTHPKAAGERFLTVSGNFMSLLEVARALKAGLGAAAARVPSRELPVWLARVLATFNSEMRPLKSELGRERNATSEKAERLLGWTPRPAAEGIVATARSLIELGLVKQPAR
jgi:nucleoside-diphosphate-sugar epimerase